MKKKLIPLFVCVMALLLSLCTVTASAYEPYATYTYSTTGEYLLSPAVYTADKYVDVAAMKRNAPHTDFPDIAEPTDLFAGPDGRIYIVDQKNSQVVVLDENYSAIASIHTFDSEHGDNDSFNKCTGLYVNDEAIYVCDTDNMRIVKFDVNTYECVDIIEQPQSVLMAEDELFLPIGIAVDQYKRLFVLSSSSKEGVIVMDEKSNFTGYIGAPKVNYSVFDMIWNEFQTAEQRKETVTENPTQFQNITADSEGFIYVTTSTIDEQKQIANLTANGTKNDGDFAPVRKLNPAGDEIMKRNGFFDCGGEVVTLLDEIGASEIVDVAVGPEGSWSIIDSRRSKVYTYDSNGVLLYAFGDKGSQLGNITTLQGITYQGDTLLLLDYTACAFTVYKRTEYGNKLIDALHNDNMRLYDQSIIHWNEVLQYNNNFDAAYIGVGKALYRNGQEEEAMEYLKAAYETETYSKAYAEIRKDWISKFILLIPVVVILFIFGITKLFKYAAKVNGKAVFKVGRKTYWEELMFAFHLIFHPFDGFWDLKHEKRGSVRGALTIMGITILAFYYQSVGRGYLANPQGNYMRLIFQILSIMVPVLLFAVSNWCLTTLFDGEGSFKDVFVAIGYALTPIPLFLFVTTLMSNIVTLTGVSTLTFVNVLAFVWAGMLIFFGVMVSHDYTFTKNIATLLGTVVSMCVIMFVVILFSTLINKMLTFVTSIVTELSYRM